jgi:RNA polymerase sigma-70 factor (ECF subfamily)
MDNGASSYRRFLDGDESGLEELLNMYGEHLIYFINGYVKNMSLAEDIMEDTFMELIVHKHRFRGESSFKTYLFRIARNKALNVIKKNKRYEQLDRDIEDIKRLEDTIIKTEMQKNIRNAMDNIKLDYSVVLELLYFEDMSYDEIGRVLKKSNKQIKNLAYRARIALKEELRKDGVECEI